MANAAFTFLKPHCAGNKKVIDYVEKQFAAKGLVVKAHGEIQAAVIDKKKLVDKHYAALARIGTTENPQELFVSAEGKENFLKEFGLSWEDALKQGLLFSGMVAMKKLKIKAAELEKRWRTVKACKLGGGFYAAKFEKEKMILLNGFYPAMRELFTAKKAFIRYYVVEWDSAKLSWKDFRGQFIGATNPAKADPNSIRGYCLAHAKEFDNLTVDGGNNVIHASASPYEAMGERITWLGADDQAKAVEGDPLWGALSAAGVTLAQFGKWQAENPTVDFNGKKQSLVDALEDLDTPIVAKNILSLVKPAAADEKKDEKKE